MWVTLARYSALGGALTSVIHIHSDGQRCLRKKVAGERDVPSGVSPERFAAQPVAETL
jgi:hypothetical protein